MNKSTRFAGLLFAAVIVVFGAGALFFTHAAGTTCYQVDCNTCCKSQGKTICTQRACP